MPQTVVRTATMPWENGLEVIAAMAQEWRDHLGPADRVADLYARYDQKTLSRDERTGRRLDLVRIAPGYRDLTNAYHDTVEECLMLAGEVTLDGEGTFDADGYFWRPPGWVHAAESAEGFTALLVVQGDDPAEGSGPPSRRIRPDEDAGTNALHPEDPEAAAGPRGWVRTHRRFLPWVPGRMYARTQGDMAGADLERLEVKVLSANPRSGGQSVLLRLAPGYREEARGVRASAMEAFVLEGSIRWGDEDLEPWDYVHVPAGEPAPALHSPGGALLFAKLDGWWGSGHDGTD
jgi:hypothetical protein